jgi:hypothetical protein
MGLHKVQTRLGTQNGLRCFRGKESAFLIQNPPAITAIKEFRTNLCLDSHDLFSYCRLAQTQDLSRSLKTPFLGDDYDSDESFHRQVQSAHGAPGQTSESQTILGSECHSSKNLGNIHHVAILGQCQRIPVEEKKGKSFPPDLIR